MEDVLRIARALESLIREMIEKPELFSFEVYPELDGRILLRATVAPSDVGRLIGMQGRTARSLRIIVSAMSSKIGQKLNLDIVSKET